MPKFYHVQIPYRGFIPVINYRGPLADVELTREQIEGLLENKVELLDPYTGKPFSLDEPPKAPAPAEVEHKVQVIDRGEEATPKAPVAPPVTPKKEEEPDAVEPGDPNTENINVDASPAAQDESTETAPDLPAIDAVDASAAEDDTDEGTDEEAKDVPAFDEKQVEIFSALSKSRRKKVRAKYYELARSGSLGIDDVYKEVNKFAASGNS